MNLQGVSITVCQTPRVRHSAPMAWKRTFLQGWDANSDLINAGVKPKKISKFFGDFGTCTLNVIWTTFGLFEVSISCFFKAITRTSWLVLSQTYPTDL